MRNRRGTKAMAATAMALAVMALWAGPAAASCAAPPPMEQAIEEAKSVFVGTVQALADEGFWATVRVEEVWKGPDLPPEVEVRGSPGSEGGTRARTSVDRSYMQGVKYLFVLHDDQPPLDDNSCNSTAEWRDEHAQYRPADARGPVAAGDGSAGTAGESGQEDAGEQATTGGESGGDEPTMVGTGPDAPVTSDDLPGSDDPGSLVHEPDAGDRPVEETEAEPASANGLDGRLLAAIAVGTVALVFGGWWLRRDA